MLRMLKQSKKSQWDFDLLIIKPGAHVPSTAPPKPLLNSPLSYVLNSYNAADFACISTFMN
ncbi:hypothetical protein KIN20_013160 [Parelaphostrongylus tenuis]|uniref:Uncharacterized protein n=1 Tax=Parelaphostrongylus tenuis TaxID=148309 RepID=A0AAD5MX30_PARTN|nr:hypothetical protein KIN20_013160 [Parelaphostrongylus tenuis]